MSRRLTRPLARVELAVAAVAVTTLSALGASVPTAATAAPGNAHAARQGHGTGQARAARHHGLEKNTPGARATHVPARGRDAGRVPGERADSGHRGQVARHSGQGGHGPHGSPFGNNGNVKITTFGAHDPIPENVAHPGCSVQIEWYGFDEGSDVVSTVMFSPQAPTADATVEVTGPATVPVGADPAGGGRDLDGREIYTLAFTGNPQPEQGYHVKLLVHTPRAHGNDTKTKVFWIEPCQDAAADTSAAGTDSAAPAPTGDASPVPLDQAAAIAGMAAGTGAAAAEVPSSDAAAGAPASAVSHAPPPVPTAVDAGLLGSRPARAGASLAALAAAVLAGAALLRRRRTPDGTGAQ